MGYFEQISNIFKRSKITDYSGTTLRSGEIKPIEPLKREAVNSEAGAISESPVFERNPMESWRGKALEELPDGDYYVQFFSNEQLKELVVANRRGHDVSVFADSAQTPEQLRYIYTHAEFGDDVSPYIHNTEFDPSVLEKRESAEFLAEIKESRALKKKNMDRKPALDDRITKATGILKEISSEKTSHKGIEIGR